MENTEIHIKEAAVLFNSNNIDAAIIKYEYVLGITNKASVKIALAVCYILKHSGKKAELLLLDIIHQSENRDVCDLMIAYNNLSNLYMTGSNGVDIDLKKAHEFYLKAKELGFPVNGHN